MNGPTESAHQRAPLVILGGGGHARVILDLFRSQQREPVGFIDSSPRSASVSALAGLHRFCSFREARSSVAGHDLEFIAAIGNNRVRAEVYAEAVEHGLRPALAIHPTAILLSGAHIAPGAQICAGTIVGVDARVGPNAIVNTGAKVDHDGRIGEHAFCAPGVLLAGNVTIGVGAHIGIGAVIREGITIGRWATVAAGAVVIRDVPEAGRVAGVPAHPMGGDDTPRPRTSG